MNAKPSPSFRRKSGFSSIGRSVLLAALVVTAIFVFFVCIEIRRSQRRERIEKLIERLEKLAPRIARIRKMEFALAQNQALLRQLQYDLDHNPRLNLLLEAVQHCTTDLVQLRELSYLINRRYTSYDPVVRYNHELTLRGTSYGDRAETGVFSLSECLSENSDWRRVFQTTRFFLPSSFDPIPGEEQVDPPGQLSFSIRARSTSEHASRPADRLRNQELRQFRQQSGSFDSSLQPP